MGTVTNSIGTAARDFSTIQAWEDALPASLVTDGNSYVGECYNDSEFTGTTSIVTFAGSTTDSTHTITLTCHAGQSFRDNASVQTNALRYNQANGVGLKTTSTYAEVIHVGDDWVTITGLQCLGSAPHSTVLGNGSSAHTVVQDCIMETVGDSLEPVLNFGGGAGVIVRNNLLVQRAGAGPGVHFSYASSDLVFINNTVVLPSDLTSTGNASTFSGPAITFTNCAIFGFSATQAGGSSSSHNASDLALGFGTSNQASKTYANQFQNTTDSTRDFRLKSGADCIDTGVTDTTNAATDIAGTSRPSGSAYDIGCWELVQTPPAMGYLKINVLRPRIFAPGLAR